MACPGLNFVTHFSRTLAYESDLMRSPELYFHAGCWSRFGIGANLGERKTSVYLRSFAAAILFVGKECADVGGALQHESAAFELNNKICPVTQG